MVLLALCFVQTPAHAEEDRSGFFDYFPAAPELKLPKLDIIPFWTDDLKTAKKAYNKGSYAKAQKYFVKSSEDGNAVADWYLGHMHRLGRGVPVNHAIAYSYYSRVAESYDPDESDANRLRIAVDSQLRMADYQRNGVEGTIKPNPELAARTYLRLSSNYGHPAAMFALGTMNIEGIGVRKNPQQGLKWLMAAARKRDAQAQAYLGELYTKGEIVKQDETRALMWYTLAVSTSNQEDIPGIFTRFNEIKWTTTEEIRLEADARARVWAEQYPAPANGD
jgi:uncharacterized protein